MATLPEDITVELWEGNVLLIAEDRHPYGAAVPCPMSPDEAEALGRELIRLADEARSGVVRSADGDQAGDPPSSGV